MLPGLEDEAQGLTAASQPLTPEESFPGGPHSQSVEERTEPARELTAGRRSEIMDHDVGKCFIKEGAVRF